MTNAAPAIASSTRCRLVAEITMPLNKMAQPTQAHQNGTNNRIERPRSAQPAPTETACATWVTAKTKTRSKNSSAQVTRCTACGERPRSGPPSSAVMPALPSSPPDSVGVSG